MIGIINYGLGNVFAIATIYKRLNINASIVSTPDELHDVEKIILPGVGAFDWAMTRLSSSGMRDSLDELVIIKGHPVLGICVGMQMMARSSEEGTAQGLGWLDAEVKKFRNTCLPHMGWNNVSLLSNNCIFRGLSDEARFYFLHSYYFAPRFERDVLALTDYGGSYASSIRRDNIFGVQFHPEKSHGWGIQLLKNFAEL